MINTLLLLMATTAPADLPFYRPALAESPIVIDGKLDDTGWSAAAWSADFADILGGDAPAPPLRTRAKFSYDDRFLYVAAELQESDVRADMRRRDDPLYRENAFELFLDPDDDGRDYLELQVNALNTIFDLLMSRPYREKGKKRLEWSVEGLKSAVHVDGTLNDPADRDRAWTIELAIPWSALESLAPDAIPPKPGTRMRLNLARTHLPRGQSKGRIFTWSPQGEVNLHAPRRWGYLEFTSTRSPRPNKPGRG